LRRKLVHNEISIQEYLDIEDKLREEFIKKLKEELNEWIANPEEPERLYYVEYEDILGVIDKLAGSELSK
jgi:predicted ribosome quality control (RQC) complex YloA/Tae2 family protein